jgi:hypothetical protein
MLAKLFDPSMGGENGTHKNNSEKQAHLAPNGSSDTSNPNLGALEQDSSKEENNGLMEPQETDTTLKDFYFGDDNDDEDDEDDEWEPSMTSFDHENSFCINCTMRSYDCTASLCEVSLFLLHYLFRLRSIIKIFTVKLKLWPWQPVFIMAQGMI